MTSLESQVQHLLAAPPKEVQRELHAQLTQGKGLQVRLDAGDSKGKGLFATQGFEAGQLLFQDPPLAAIQHTANRPEAWVCGHCFRFIGSLEQQIARQIMNARQEAQNGHGHEHGHEHAHGFEGDAEHFEDGGMQREAALALEEELVLALASGQLHLPCTDAFPLPQPVACRGGCCEEWYCSSSCAEAAWQQYHQLLCVAPEPSEHTDEAEAGSSSRGKAAAAAPAEGQQQAEERRQQEEQLREGLREFCQHADSTNDMFRLAAQVVARVLLSAERTLAEEQAAAAAGGSGSSSCSSSSGSGGQPSADACWRALLAGWQPFAGGHKGLWWECTSDPEAAADMRLLAADSLELLCAALPPHLVARYPALLDLRVWGSIIGMFDLNNLALFVPNPLQPWLEHLHTLQPEQQAEAQAVTDRFTDALPEELPMCEGNAFYALHSCCNHSCEPNAHAFKRDQDQDGSAVILALKDIQPGEEVTLSYTDVDAPLEERREQLADYGFVCCCDKCAREEELEEDRRLAAELAAELQV